MLAESNQEGSRRQGGTRNGPKQIVVFGCTERRLGGPASTKTTRKGMHVCLGDGWAY